MRVGIIGAPLDLGADRRGVDMGASAVRYTDLEGRLRAQGHTVKDLGNVTAPVPESTSVGDPRLKYLDSIIGVAGQLSERVSGAIDAGWFPLILGGDHSVSLGSVAGVAQHKRVGLIWLDAHADFNVPETSPSGNIHGMVLSALTGYGAEPLVQLGGASPRVSPANVALVGVRDIDQDERKTLLSSGVHVFSMYDIDRMGLLAVMELAIERSGRDMDGIHCSLDLDVVDPTQAPGVGTPVLGGLNYRETHLAMELLAESGCLTSMDVVEVNPILDNHNETARLAMEFILSALGKRIL